MGVEIAVEDKKTMSRFEANQEIRYWDSKQGQAALLWPRQLIISKV